MKMKNLPYLALAVEIIGQNRVWISYQSLVGQALMGMK